MVVKEFLKASDILMIVGASVEVCVRFKVAKSNDSGSLGATSPVYGEFALFYFNFALSFQLVLNLARVPYSV
jgi:hypothetical protein